MAGFPIEVVVEVVTVFIFETVGFLIVTSIGIHSHWCCVHF
jgi:hypothetical protein